MCQDELSMVKSRRHTKRAINEDRKHLVVGTMTFKWLNSKSIVPPAKLTSGTIASGCLSFFSATFFRTSPNSLSSKFGSSQAGAEIFNYRAVDGHYCKILDSCLSIRPPSLAAMILPSGGDL